MSYSVETKSGLRELLNFRRDPLAYVAEAGRRSIDIRRFRFPGRLLFQVNHPELIRDVLITHDWNFVKGDGLHASKPVLGQGLLTSEGELHRRQRRMVQPAFHSTRLTGYGETMVACASDVADEWQDGACIAVDQEMMRLTLRIVGKALFSADLKRDAAGVGASLTRALDLFLKLNHPLTRALPPLRKRMEAKGRAVRSEIEAVLRRVIDEHRAHPGADDMLSMMMHARDDASTGFMSDELLLDESLTIFLAGHETTANALAWTWHLLGQHPRVTRRMYAEIDDELRGRLPQPADMAKLAYTACVFREALRLYPPAWVVGREAVTDYLLSDVHVPAGSTLLMSPYATQRDPRWWLRAEEFFPERWMEENVERPRFAFYPFGAGTRVCIGEHFAQMEGVLLLATLAQHWKLHPVPGQRIETWPQITLRPRNPILMQLERRSGKPSAAARANENEMLESAATLT